MNIVLKHIIELKTVKDDCVFIGHEYKNFIKVKNSSKVNLIDLSSFIKNEQDKNQDLMIKFIDDLKREKKQSIHFQMSHLANKNNRASSFFDIVIQLEALRTFLLKNRLQSSKITIVCEDSFILQSIYQLSEFDTKRNFFYRTCFFYDWSKLIIRAGFYFHRQIYRMFKRYIASLVTKKNTTKNLPKESIYLIHQCLDDSAFLNSNKIYCRYFLDLPDFLSKKGKKVFRIPWLYNNQIPFIRIYRSLRKHNFLIPEDFLKPKDYLKVFADSFKSILSIPLGNYKFHNIDLNNLLLRERLIFSGTSFNQIEFWKVYRALPAWTRKLTKVSLIDVFEMDNPERFLSFFFKNHFEGNSYHLGYYHSLLSKDYLACNLSSDDINSSTFPDVLVTSGELGRNYFINQGVSRAKVKSGPAIRQNFTEKVATKQRGDCVSIILPLDQNASIEILDKVFMHHNFFLEKEIKILIKQHPMANFKRMMKKINWNDLPVNCFLHEGDMMSLVRKTRCFIVLDSAAIFDILMYGSPVLSLARSLGPNWNNADILENKFKFLQSIKSEEIPQRISCFYQNNSANYIKDYEKISMVLKKGLNMPNKLNMSNFIFP